MAMLEIQDIHKSFYTYDDKPRCLLYTSDAADEL